MMARSNAIVVPGFPSIEPNRQAEMAAYDRLPYELRRAVDDMIYQASCRVVLADYRRNGLQSVLANIKRSEATYLRAARREREAETCAR